MPLKTTTEKQDDADQSAPASTSKESGYFSIPAPLKKLFDLVPVVTYPPNQLPRRAPKPARIPSLYVFSNDRDSAAGRPSFNPSCLKWQTFLNIAGIDHRLISSNNHASPTGALPFLLPVVHSSEPSEESLLPIPANKFVKYATEHGGQVEESSSIRYEAYQSLLDHRIRNAWLYNLYLEPLNFSAVAYPLYVSPTSSNPLVRASISYQLRSAAEAELLKHTSIINIDDMYSEADKAFEALSILLGKNKWFFGNDKPALFDASVFAYTQLLLDDGLRWKEKKLCLALRRRENLVQHRERLLRADIMRAMNDVEKSWFGQAGYPRVWGFISRYNTPCTAQLAREAGFHVFLRPQWPEYGLENVRQEVLQFKTHCVTYWGFFLSHSNTSLCEGVKAIAQERQHKLNPIVDLVLA